MADCKRCGRRIRVGDCCSALLCQFGKLLYQVSHRDMSQRRH